MPNTQTVSEPTDSSANLGLADEPLLTIAEVAEKLRLSPWSVRELCRKGELEVIYLGPKTIRVEPAALRAYRRGRPTTRPAPANA